MAVQCPELLKLVCLTRFDVDSKRSCMSRAGDVRSCDRVLLVVVASTKVIGESSQQGGIGRVEPCSYNNAELILVLRRDGDVVLAIASSCRR